MPTNLVKKFNLFEYPWDTKKGLIYYSFWMMVLLAVVYIWFSNIFFTAYVIWTLLFVFFLTWWLYRRLNFFYFKNKLFVIFAVTIDYENQTLKKLYASLIDNFKEKLKVYNLSKSILVKTKPVDIVFSDNSAAEAKTKFNMPCSTLIVSGLPITDKKEIEFKFNFHYEFRHPGGENKKQIYKEIFGKKVAKSLEGKNWRVKDKIESKKNLYGDTFNVCTYILSLCMASLGRSDDAIKLLEPIREEINKNLTKKEYGPLIADIRKYLFSINEAKFNFFYWSLDPKKLKPIANELERLDKRSYTTDMAWAIIYELEGNRALALKHTKNAENYHPTRDYSYLYNYLYFHLSEDNFDEAIKVLEQMRKMQNQTFISPVINFLYNRYEVTNQLSLLFNTGVVILLWGEEKLGRKELQKFIRKANGKEKYKSIVEYSKKLLDNSNAK